MFTVISQMSLPEKLNHALNGINTDQKLTDSNIDILENVFSEVLFCIYLKCRFGRIIIPSHNKVVEGI